MLHPQFMGRRWPEAMTMLSSAEQSIISWSETHNLTGFHDGHPDISFDYSVIIIGIDRHQY